MLDVGAIIDQFRAAMRAQGIDIRGKLIADGLLHRAHVEGDKARTESAWYILHADEHPNGTYGCWKRFGRDKLSWSAKETTEWTPEQRRDFHDRMERQRLEREAADLERHVRAAERATAVWDESEPAADNHPYLKAKGCKAHGIRVGRWDIVNPSSGEITTVSKLALLIPIRDTRKNVRSLQAIFPHDRNVLHRNKDYLKDGEKHGLFFTIGSPVDNTILVCEGYATGASLHECTGHAVAIAFDTSNIEPSANILRQRFADSKIVICADNDRWTEKPVVNPGVHYAEAAATVIGGLVAIPQFQNLESKPTDFNDLARLEGPAAVKAIIDEVLARPIEEPDEPPPLEGDVILKSETSPGEPPPPEDEEDDGNVNVRPSTNLVNNPFFEVLGFEHGDYFFFLKDKRQVMTYSRGELSESTFVELADPALFWMQHFKTGAKKGSFNKLSALNFLIRTADEKGIYDADRIRGRGAWLDEGRAVFHHGDRLTVDDARVEIGSLKTSFIYELQRPLQDIPKIPLSDEEGDELLNISCKFRWTKPASAALLCGWMMLAPICGALRWRPHIWLSGGAGSGKSTVLNEFVHPLLNGFDLFAQGNTTEAGLRQKLRTDALPILFEESEQNEDKDRMRIQHVLSLIRQSSTESHARVYKGTVGGHSMEFLIRSMFCLASIQVGLKHQADIERLTVLSLMPKRSGVSEIGDWEVLKTLLHERVACNKGVGAKLVRRAMLMLPTIRDNIHVFSMEAAKIFGTQREGDQYGSLLAGTWSLFNTQVATPLDAEHLINSFTWEEHRDTADTDESLQALAALMGSRLRAPKGQEYTVHELAAAACGKPVLDVEIDKLHAKTILQRYGMVIKDESMLLSNSSHELRVLMSGTTFAADWRGVLLRTPGADRNDNRVAKFNGVASKCIRIPLGSILIPGDEAIQQSWLSAEQPVER